MKAGAAVKQVITKNIMNVIFLAVGLFVMGESRTMRTYIFRNIGNNPATFPWLLGLVITLLASAVIITDSTTILLKMHRMEVPESSTTGSILKTLILPGVILISSTLFTALVPILGYMIGAILWMVILMIVLRTPKMLMTASIVAVLIIVTYLVFLWYLPVRLPRGWILFW